MKRHSKSPDLTVWIAHAALVMLWEEAEEHIPLETGGLLLGYRVSAIETVVTQLVGPGLTASHRKDGFAPDSDYQEAELGRIYGETDGKVTYLGDWHTHPGSSPYPSLKDQRTIARIARAQEARCELPLMVLVGQGDGGDWQALAWQGQLGRRNTLMVDVATLKPFSGSRLSAGRDPSHLAVEVVEHHHQAREAAGHLPDADTL